MSQIETQTDSVRASWNSRLKALLRRFIHFLLGEYQLFFIYELDLSRLHDADASALLEPGYEFCELSQEDALSSAEQDVRNRAFYGGDGAWGFAVRAHGRLVSVHWYWFGDRYRQRNFWPLQQGEAKLVELFSLSSERGKGLATALNLHSALEMRKKGFQRLYSRIWHSNMASRRVSEKVGWCSIAFVAEFYPLRTGRKLRYVRRLRSKMRHGTRSDAVPKA